MQNTSLSNRKTYHPFLLILAAAFLLRVFCTFLQQGFATDTACFHYWSLRLWENGFGGFYAPDYFCDYPPGYLYVLYPIGGILSFLGLDTISGFSLLIVRMPSIIADLISGILLYTYAKKYFSSNTALYLTASYLFHPAVFFNSALWGQVDAVFTLLLLLCCILLTSCKYIPAYFLFALCILIKPQSLVFAPLILCSLWEQIVSHHSLRSLFKNILGGLCAIACIILLAIPFGLDKVFEQYTTTLSSYPYAAVNAFNVWGLFAQNWVPQDTMLGFATYDQWSTIFLILITLLSFFIFYLRRGKQDRYYLTGAFLISSVFLFAVRMHERYLFPVMLLLLFTYIHNREKMFFRSFNRLSLCHFGNVFWSLFFFDISTYNRKSFVIILLSFFTVLYGLQLYRSIYHFIKTGGSATSPGQLDGDPLPHAIPTFRIPKDSIPHPSRSKMPLTKADWIFLIGIPCFYALFAFTNLGTAKAPVSELAFPYNTYLELDAVGDQQISTIYWYLGNEQDIICKLETKTSPDAPWTYIQDFELADVFEWESLPLSTPATSIRITNITEDAVVREFIFTDTSGALVDVAQSSAYYPLFDEADTFSGTIDATNTTIFDEIYYTRTVYEFLNGLPAYEFTHPPLGKILITIGTFFFGTSPLGFRFVGALFGVLMLPFLYLFARNLTGERILGAFVSFLFAFDFMHFTQTRIATIDVFITFFILVMYYFMERYCSVSFYDVGLRKTFIPLGACGIAFGLGIATKWTGFYAGAGLAILFFLQLLKRYLEYRHALQTPKAFSNGISHALIIKNFKVYAWKTIGFCMIFFVAIPACIYLLSYVPFVDSAHPGLFARMLANQKNMFQYHSTLTATHPYSSLWYTWPVMSRPILYYAETVGEELRQGISAFGNPLVWWGGISAFLYTGYLAIWHKNKTACFLCISYLAQYLPWVFISRCTFIYHYFPSVPFVALMIGFSFLQFKKELPGKKFTCVLFLYALAAFVLFIMFYPVLAGTTVSTNYVDQFLRWLDGWVLVI